MLSKEEIEKAKETTKNYIKDTPVAPFECLMNEERKSAIVLLEYIEQLESDNYEQNNIINNYIDEREELIEKLEEDIEQHTYGDIEIDATGQYAKEILSILKGE